MKRAVKILPGSLVLAIATMAGPVWAVPTIDGSASVGDGYGAALSIQDTTTQFGDNSSDDLIATASGGSEIDQVFGKVENGRLYMVVTGNLETNFNKLEVFIDVDGASGGVNAIDGGSLPASVDGFCCTSGSGHVPDPNDGALQRMSGLVFDAGFNADYYLTFSNGGENVGGNDFWAINAHYADLTDGVNGRNVDAGIQLAAQGMPNVLRFPFDADFDNDADADGSDLLIWQRNNGNLTGTATREQGDANADGNVDRADLSQWRDDFGVTRALTDLSFVPRSDTPPTTALIGPALPGLSQGTLIDKNYALGPDGGCTAASDDGGAGCIAPELEFVLPFDSNDSDNSLNHRNFDNMVGLELGFNNSNIAGVEGGDGSISITGDPENVITGIEFSIGLDQLLDSQDSIPQGDIRVTAFVNGTGHDFASNQFAGKGIEAGNPGEFNNPNILPPDLDFDYAGDQFVTISQAPPAASAVPEPASWALVLLGALACGTIARLQG